MPDKSPLLTIAIPTFNRAKYLQELLATLFDQLVAQHQVELLVSDNASADDTPSIVEGFIMRGLAIRYLRNEANIGADANFLQCFEQSRGQYVWIFGDDDVIVPGGIGIILNLLHNGDYSLIYLSQYAFVTDHVAARTSDKFGRVAQVLPGGLELARMAGATIGFISAMIVNKDLYSTIPHPLLGDFNGTNLMQLGWVCPLMASSSRTLFVWARLVGARGANTSGWGIGKVFGVNFKQITDRCLTNRRDIAQALQKCMLQKWFPNMIMETRWGTGIKFETENMREILEPIYRARLSYWICVFPHIVLPLRGAEAWYSVIKLSRLLQTILSALWDSTFLSESFVMNSPPGSPMRLGPTVACLLTGLRITSLRVYLSNILSSPKTRG
jgi:abequosyltransferase